jgi:transglutaminase-like putative cysteine protease
MTTSHPASRSPRATSRHRRRAALSLASTAALLSGLPLLHPLLQTQVWVVPAVGATVTVMAIGWAARRLAQTARARQAADPASGGPARPSVPALLLASAAQLGALVVFCGAVASRDGVLGVVPTSGWMTGLREAWAAGLDVIATEPAPVPATPGVTVVVVAGVGLAALGMDSMAAWGRPGLGGLVLLGELLVVVAVDGVDPPQWAVAVAAAGYLVLLAVSSATDLAPTDWMVAGEGTRARVGSVHTLLIGSVAVAAGLLAPGLLPQGELSAIGDGRGGGRQITTSNPIVDLRQELLRPDNVPVIHYRTTAESPDYLRMVSLDRFDGTSWFTAPRAVPATQTVQSGLPEAPGRSGWSVDPEDVDYSIVVGPALDSQWLPLPYPTREVDITGDWRYDAATLDVVAARGSTAESSYRAVAEDFVGATELAQDLVPTRPEAASAPNVRDDPTAPPDAAGADLLAVPSQIRAELEQITAEVTAEAQGDAAIGAALQRWFRSDGGFVYDIAGTPAGSGVAALRMFLSERSGYCEQYAATMALMARTAGVPARVAVGYRPGRGLSSIDSDAPPVEGEGPLRQIRAHDAHAWPELYVDGIGWLRYEPTPADVSGAPPPYSVSSPDPVDEPGGATPEAEPEPAAPMTDDDGMAPMPADAADELPRWVFVTVAAAVVLGMIVLLPPAAGAAARWLRQRRQHSDRAAQAWLAIDDVAATARRCGFGWPSGGTPAQAGAWIAGVASMDDAAREDVATFVGVVEQAWFADPAPSTDDDLWRVTASVRGHVREGARPMRRMWDWWCPWRPTRSAADAVADANLRLGGARSGMAGGLANAPYRLDAASSGPRRES